MNILVLTQWSFNDALVQTYTLPYVRIMRSIVDRKYKIMLVTSEQQHVALNPEEIESINEQWKNDNMQLVAQPYKRFGWRKMLSSFSQLGNLYRIIRKNKIGVIHAFCTPAGSLAYILSKLTGAQLIIDSYEPHAESMVENGTWKRSGLAYKILWRLERAQTKKAKHLIATTGGMQGYAKEKFGVNVKSFFVKPACVDLSKFNGSKNIQLEKELDLDNKIVCVYAGKLGGIYLRDEVFDLIKLCYERWGDKFRFLMLSNTSTSELKKHMDEIGIPYQVIINKFVPHSEVPSYLSIGDFAINPVKPVPTKRYCTSIKDGEYWAMGLPVVISPGISDDSSIIYEEKIGVVVNFSDNNDLKRALIEVEDLINRGEELKQKIRSIAKKYRSYDIAQEIYKNIYG